MRIVILIEILYKLRLLSPAGLFRLIKAIFQYGMNVMALLRIAERTYGQKVAIVDDHETITYQQLWSQSEHLALAWKQTYGLNSDKKVGILCKNHASLVKAIFATSYTGADLYMLNTEMSARQLNQSLDGCEIDLLIYDEELTTLIEQSTYAKDKLLSYHDQLPAINNLTQSIVNEKFMLRRASSSKIMLLTGGTTGASKKVPHKPSLFHYLPPLSALLSRLHLFRYQTTYIATPIYHGYGIAFLLLCVALGKRIVLTAGFEPAKACDRIREHQVEVVTVVPLMLYKMLKHSAADLKSLACIASGGAELNPKLAAEVFSTCGDILYNLYGTSEAGLMVIATPADLKASPNTIGKKIEHVRLSVLDHQHQKLGVGEIGQLCVKNTRFKHDGNQTWIGTGDLGYRDERGYYYLCGRTDDRVISAGENVYPIDVEQILIHHTSVEDVAVIGIPDETFGQRLKAFVQSAPHADLTKEQLLEWLRPRVARYQMPKEIVFVEQIPYTHLGKVDKKQLS
ncbi:AMP-binding protein [Brevibacillus invocatus]|uniref:AMP-binding protein n=1 Tax=Brevibacillus invocatus TaxID=173959 RepID=UPI00203C006D|nr:AMP-binding protein [Brevibacillus invocatus]MCM3428356.1 AMP-binding protein [Brevibacillus invocatus]